MSNSKEMVNCLRKISAEKLHEAHYELFFKWHKDSVEREPMNVFSPRRFFKNDIIENWGGGGGFFWYYLYFMNFQFHVKIRKIHFG